MLKDSIPLLTDTGNNWEVVGPSIKSDGWYSMRDGLHTIMVKTNNLRGRLIVEATLAADPNDVDWFPINLLTDASYIQFPINPNSPAGNQNNTGDTRTMAFTFIGKFSFVRARLDRSYLTNPGEYGQTAVYGKIVEVLLTQ
jgi:hypothetical protein